MVVMTVKVSKTVSPCCQPDGRGLVICGGNILMTISRQQDSKPL
jgi:hypothetical protein